MYAAIAVGLIVVLSGLLTLALRWAQRRGYVRERGLLWLTLAVFLMIFITNVVRAFGDPFPEPPLYAVIQWGVVIGSLAIVAIAGVKIARTR